MPSKTFLITLSTIPLLLSLLYTPLLHPILIVGLGLAKSPLPLSSFPNYSCHQLRHPEIQACEDMYFSQTTDQLLLACSEPLRRKNWLPNMGLTKGVQERSKTDRFVVLDTTTLSNPSGPDVRVLKVEGFKGGELHLVGFGVLERKGGRALEIFAVNNSPARDAEGKVLAKVDARIEQFRYERGREEVVWVRTWSDAKIVTPNNVAPISDKEFFITNDHGYHTSGLSFELSPILGTGNVIRCSLKVGCSEVASGLAFPNGLMTGPDGRIWVPSAARGDIHIFSYDRKNMSAPLKKDEVISTNSYFVDNLSQDSEGNVWGASGVGSLNIGKQLHGDPEYSPPSTALKVSKKDGKWVAEKAVEDRDSEVLPGTTTVVHDAKTGRLFFSGIVSPFIGVCDRK